MSKAGARQAMSCYTSESMDIIDLHISRIRIPGECPRARLCARR